MTAYEFLLVVYFLMWYGLIIAAISFIISGLDDLFIDFYYWTRYLIRRWNAKQYPALTYQQLLAKPQQLIAVLVPCWNEANVIGIMLQHNSNSIDYENYYFFVGVYPNDPDTVAEVQQLEGQLPRVKCVLSDRPGPTNKAANLNNVYRYIKNFENELGRRFDIFVFHDSEDIIHPRSFLLYNYLIPRKEMIQIPVFPLAVPYRNFTHWIYADEFSENHTKDIIVRESIRGHVPSAGVGTAFSRRALQVLEDPQSQTPFSIDSLTEDYRTSLAIRFHGLKQIFVTQKITRMVWKKTGFFRRRYKDCYTKEYIATRALFPMEYKKAVRQKARWIIGIVFQEWSHTQWPSQWVIRYTLAHDRKSFITHFINGFGYFVFLFWLLYSLFTYANPTYPSLQEQLNLHPWVWWLIVTVTLLMLQRMVQRMIAVIRVYSWIPALLSIPRVFYGNFLNLHALCRAYYLYFTAPKDTASNKQPSWDKTDHHFPGSHILTPHKRRLGDLLIENQLLSKDVLQDVIMEQQETGERLGRLLCRKNLISARQLLELLALQYKLDLFPQSQLEAAQQQCRATIPPRIWRWLQKHAMIPVACHAESKSLTLAIEDPTNEDQIEKTINFIAPYSATFVIIDFTA